MQLAEPAFVFAPVQEPASERIAASGWRAELAIRLERRGERSVVAARRHDGPLVMQKALHPEGDAVCHIIVLHPPGGIAGGDELELRVHVGGNAHGLLATPGAGKWYRSAGARARQRVCFTLESDACLEWLPQETIVFDGALAAMTTAIHLADRARYIGWEITCLGRTGSGERFTHGTARMQTRIDGPRGPVFIERGELAGGAALLESAAGLGAQPVFGTLLAAAETVDKSLLTACREVQPVDGAGTVTWLPNVLVARYLGPSTQAARHYFIALWKILRPALLGRDAVEPRIWST